MRVVLFLAALLPVSALACNTPPTPPSPSQTTSAALPWPECRPILGWLEKNLADPSGFEVIEWKKRTPLPEYRRVDVIIRYRAKNRFGGMSVWDRGFKVHDNGTVQGSAAAEQR